MNGKTLSDFQDIVQTVSNTYARKFGIERDAAWYLEKLTEELGELAAADLKCRGRARSDGKTASDLEAELANEAADLFAHLLLFCDDRGIDLDQAIAKKWMRYLPAPAQPA